MSEDATRSSGTEQFYCDGCEEWHTFTESTDGLASDKLVCDECGYLPRKAVRDEIRERYFQPDT